MRNQFAEVLDTVHKLPGPPLQPKRAMKLRLSLREHSAAKRRSLNFRIKSGSNPASRTTIKASGMRATAMPSRWSMRAEL